MNRTRDRLAAGVSLLVVASLVLAATQPACANVEIDALAAQFSSGFGSIARKTGMSENVVDAGQQMNVAAVDQKLRQLYTTIEKSLMDARQRAANARSSLTSAAIDKLRIA